jgi:tetratricopeptide (TPR) repeat protein
MPVNMIWSSEIREVEKLYDSIKGQFPYIDKELEHLIKTEDPNVILLYSRRCLEVIITDLCESELNRPRKTEPLQGIIDKLKKGDVVPEYIATSMNGLNSLSNYGTHPKDFDPEQVKPVLNNLSTIIKWYLKYKSIKGISDSKEKEEVKQEVRIGKQEKTALISKYKLLSGVIIIVICIILAVLAFPKIFHTGKNKVAKDPDGRISIAVTAFESNTNDTTLNWLIKGIPELIRNNLTGSEELSVQNSQTMFELYQNMGQTQNASIGPSLSREAAIKLKTGTYITGSFQKFGNNILTYIKLVDTKSDELLWTGSIEGNLDKYKYLADSLSAQLKDFLEIKVIRQKAGQEYNDANTNSPEALKKYVEGMQLMINGNFQSAARSFEESYRSDTTFTLAALYASMVFSYDYNYVPTIKWTKIAYRDKKRLPYYYQLWIESGVQCNITKNCDSVLYYNYLLAQSDIKSRLFWMDIGYNYLFLEQNQKAVEAFKKVENISTEWGGDWKFINYYIYFGLACHKAGIHDKEAMVYKTGLKLFPDNMGIIYYQARCAIATGDTSKATGLINKLVKIANEQNWPESSIETGYGDLFAAANSLDKAEQHYRIALKLDPNNYSLINTVAYFFIKNDRNVDEAEELVKRSLQIKPGNIIALHIQGLVWYKRGKYEDALNIMEQAYAKYTVWTVPLFNDIKKVKKALANQK